MPSAPRPVRRPTGAERRRRAARRYSIMLLSIARQVPPSSCATGPLVPFARQPLADVPLSCHNHGVERPMSPPYSSKTPC